MGSHVLALRFRSPGCWGSRRPPPAAGLPQPVRVRAPRLAYGIAPDERAISLRTSQRNTTRRRTLTLPTLRGRLEQPDLDYLAAPPHAANALRPAAAQAHRAALRRRVRHGELVRCRRRDVQRAVHKRRLAVGACGGQGRRGLACVAALFVDDAYAVASGRRQACVVDRHARVPVGLGICRCTHTHNSIVGRSPHRATGQPHAAADSDDALHVHGRRVKQTCSVHSV
jgi:hypothetical protein